MAPVRVASTSDVPVNQCRVFSVDGKSIALANANGEFYAVDNLCTHDNGPLGEGRIDRNTIECPRHGARFDLRTGAVRALPAVRPIRTYPVSVDGSEVSVDVG
jgi:3-phenylpropionate/trans-cinnamate dioxygenase ferredoxin subunit